MTIRRRVTLSFLLVLVLTGLNLVIFFWSSVKRRETVEDLRRASARQLVLASIREDLNDVQKQVNLLSQILSEAEPGRTDTAGLARFSARLDGIGRSIQGLRELATSDERRHVEAFGGAFLELAASWRVFYENLGVRQSKAITELAVRAEPLGQRVMQELLPELQREERKLVEEAGTNFYNVARLTAQITVVIFVLSAVVAAAAAFQLSRNMVGRLRQLEQGAALIGSGHFEHAISIEGQDELSRLGRAFNEMRDHLLTARTQLTQANQELERRHEDLRVARDSAESANRAKSGFLANMSHELRTPMNAIIGYSEMLIEDAEAAGQEASIPDLKKIHGAGHHLLALINDILDLSKIEAGRMDLYLETFDVESMLRGVATTIQPLVEKNANHLDVRCEAGVGSMRADLTKVRQVLFNLLSNSSKFTTAGHIDLEATRQAAPPCVIFRVRDSGIGMTQDQLSRVFDSFTQADASIAAKYGGTGLGLTISRKFCEMMGGTITAESEPGTGTLFTIRLPAEVADRKAESVVAVDSPGISRVASLSSRPSPLTALVIDDDPVVVDLMQTFLGREGYRVVSASNGEDGLRLAREIRPNVITLDVIMPGLDGWSVLTAMKADPILAATPVILLTITDNKSMGYALGAAECLTKPIDRDHLLAMLEKHVKLTPAFNH
ncbi:MAG: ATP-binding protein [Acidobacteriota bacterium]